MSTISDQRRKSHSTQAAEQESDNSDVICQKASQEKTCFQQRNKETNNQTTNQTINQPTKQPASKQAKKQTEPNRTKTKQNTNKLDKWNTLSKLDKGNKFYQNKTKQSKQIVGICPYTSLVGVLPKYYFAFSDSSKS